MGCEALTLEISLLIDGGGGGFLRDPPVAFLLFLCFLYCPSESSWVFFLGGVRAFFSLTVGQANRAVATAQPCSLATRREDLLLSSPIFWGALVAS